MKTSSSYNPSYYAKHRTGFRDAAERYRKTERGYKTVMLNSLRARARKKGVDFRLGIDTVPWTDKCPLFGTPLRYTPNTFEERLKAPTIVRKDTAKGYVPNNVEVVSYKASKLLIPLYEVFTYLRKAPRGERRQFVEWIELQLTSLEVFRPERKS